MIYCILLSIAQLHAVNDTHEVPNNFFRLNNQLFNGAAPHLDIDYDALANLGVRTVISVDGAMPNVQAAELRGLGYVHIPLGYDGIDQQEGLALVKAVRERPAPVYVHCYHGQHRSPAAVAYIAVAEQWMSAADAVALMHEFGVSREYDGLYKAVELADPIPKQVTQLLDTELPRQAVVSDVVTAMAYLGRSWDRLEMLADENWQVSERHPDVSPAHESRILLSYIQSLRDSKHLSKLQLDSATRAAQELADQLSSDPIDAKSSKRAFERVRSACLSCHKAHRN